MSMDRSRMVSILASMSDEALVRAMQANNIPVDDCSFSDSLGGEAAEGMESWSEMDVSIPRSERPRLVNSDVLFKSDYLSKPQGGDVLSTLFQPESGEDEGAAAAQLGLFG